MLNPPRWMGAGEPGEAPVPARPWAGFIVPVCLWSDKGREAWFLGMGESISIHVAGLSLIVS